jgi:hypothetical protein
MNNLYEDNKKLWSPILFNILQGKIYGKLSEMHHEALMENRENLSAVAVVVVTFYNYQNITLKFLSSPV